MSGTLPHWLAGLLGLKNATGEDILWELAFSWPWPAWLTFVFLACAAAFVAWIYYHEGQAGLSPRRILSAFVRFALFGTVLFMLAQPVVLLKRSSKPTLTFLLDDSLSMTFADHYPEKQQAATIARMKNASLSDQPLSRWNLIVALTNENHAAWLHRLSERYKLQTCFLTDMQTVRGRTPVEMAAEIRAHAPHGRDTRLGDGIRKVLDETTVAGPAAVVILTDGINTVGLSLAEAAELARCRNVPVYFLGVGSEQPPKDLAISEIMANEVVFVGDVVAFECKITAHSLKGRQARVLLRENGKPEVLAQTTIVLGEDGVPQSARLSLRVEQEGRFAYVIEVPPLEGEQQKENNRRACTLEVRKGKIRLLLADGPPRYEFRYLRNLFRREENISLKTLLQDADPEYAAQNEVALTGFPVRQEELFEYDVVIFGDLDPKLLGRKALEMLAEFVERPAKGGALVLIAGEKFMPAAYGATPLAKLFPFTSGKGHVAPARIPGQGFRPLPTAFGAASPGMQLDDDIERAQQAWRELPPLYWLLALPELKPGVRTLAEFRPDGVSVRCSLPVVCFQYVGSGKVLFHATDETCRWRYRRGETLFARYWLQTVRWLCRPEAPEKASPLTLESECKEYALGESVRLQAKFTDERFAPAADDGVTVILESSQSKRRQIRLQRAAISQGVFEATLKELAPGNYRAWIVEPALGPHPPATEFIIAPPVNEFARLHIDSTEMQRAATISGGKYFTFEEADRLVKELPTSPQAILETFPPRPLWNSWPLVVIFLGLLITEWILRKWSGLV